MIEKVYKLVKVNWFHENISFKNTMLDLIREYLIPKQMCRDTEEQTKHGKEYWRFVHNSELLLLIYTS